jgi:formylmethanofuran dehydrogenase subunit C
VSGRVGPWAGAQMRGGVLEIGGDAGDCVGGALPGDTRGMNGGLVIVRGSAGAHAGERMRRGMIAIAGDAGAYAASRMIAGTILVLGVAAPYIGFGMRRGTVLLRSAPARWLPTFADAGSHELAFLRVLARSFSVDEALRRTLADLGPRVRRHVGDAAAAGRGEILVW